MSDFPINPLVLIGAGSSFAFSGLFYHLYQEKKEELKKLKQIPLFRPDEDLVKIVTSSPHKRLKYVAVEGMVQAEGEPLASKFVPQCFGVIQKLTVEDHGKYWNSLTRTWNARRINRKESSNSVPFCLVSPGAYIADLCVKVSDPLGASGCYLERVHHKLKPAEESLVDVVVQGISGEKAVAQEESEELLRVGTTVTGFGEVILEGGRVIRLQAPQDGRRFILVPTDYGSFISRHESSAKMWKTLTAVSGITGTALLVGLIHSVIKQQDDRSK